MSDFGGESPTPESVRKPTAKLVRKPIMSEGRKDDQDKDPWHLLPWDAVRAIVKILAFGADKYAPRNWEGGMAWSRPYSAAIRHLSAWWEGEDADPESGYSHLWHAGCCLLFLIAYEMRHVGTDDRPWTLRNKSWAEAAVRAQEREEGR